MKNEKRLIDANALKWKLERVTLYVQGLRFGKTMLGKILESYRRAVFEEIDNARTVDAVEVVRCKDCMWARPKDHREPTLAPRELVCQCAKHHYIPAPWGERMAVSTDDFCSYGERKVVTK